MSLPNRSNINSYNASAKVNNQLLPPTVPTIDWDNPSLARAISDVAAMGLTAPRVWIRATLASTTGGMNILNWQAQWGNVTTTPPIPARTSDGYFTFTLPTVVSDEYDASLGTTNNITLVLNGAQASLEGPAYGFVNAFAINNVIYVCTANTSGSNNDLASSVIFIVGY